MIVLGTISWVLLLSNGLLFLTTAAHVCDSQDSNDYICDPVTNGTKYFVCAQPGGTHEQFDCPSGLHFSNAAKVCDWPNNTPTCVADDSSPTTTTTTTTATTTTTTAAATAESTTTTPSTTKPPTPTQPTTTSFSIPTTTSSVATKAISELCVGVADGTSLCDPATSGTTFIICWNNVVYYYNCPSSLLFNKKTGACDWPYNIDEKCVAGNVPTRQTPSPTVSADTTTTTTTTTTTAPYPSGSCNSNNCQLPDCRCIGTDIPGNLPLSDVPQMILLTFDDGINVNNDHYYDLLFPEDKSEALKNPNQCRTAATFFVSNDYNDMTTVRKLWNRDNEMASHSLTHSSPSGWNSDKWKQEMQGMRAELASELGVNVSQIHGMRVPFLDLGGETQFSMMQYNHITYDSSMFGGSLDGSNTDHPVWPFSLHYPPTNAVCVQPNCPTRSYPEVWEVPIIRQYNLAGNACSMTDSCQLPYDASADDVTAFLRHNFQRHNSTNRAPFMLSLHATWFYNVPASFQGLRAFLNETNADPNVWQVTVTQMLDWVRHPVPRDRVTELDSWKMCA